VEIASEGVMPYTRFFYCKYMYGVGFSNRKNTFASKNAIERLD